MPETTLRAQDNEQIQLANEYLLKGDKKKAVEVYRELAKSDRNIPLIHNNYINVLIDLGQFDDAQSYVKKISKKEPDNLQYRLDLGLIYSRNNDAVRADRHFKDLINEKRASLYHVKLLSDYFSAHSLLQYAVLSLTEGRKAMNNPYLYSLELAMMYRMQGLKDKMVDEYLNYVTQNSGNAQYVKNIMQTLLTKPEELESLEKLLYTRVQEQPDVEVYADLLIWVTMQQKNFYASFIQARAYDKRYKKEGEKSMEVAQVALDNGDYDNAVKIFRYVAKEYIKTANYFPARLGIIRSREAQIKNSFPVNNDSVKSLITDYKKYITQYPDNNTALEATRSKALLFANYLNEKDSAIKVLNRLIANPKASLYLKSRSKLDLGDIYILKNEPWESTLLYSQVEKVQRDNQIGYDAKLRNAKLSYYKGDFRLAQEHLDILKEATTREIANDALDLSMRIKENLAFDSVGTALKAYAAIELLLYQNKIDDALKAIENMKQGIHQDMFSTVSYSNYGILDDAYWLEATIRMKKGEFKESIALLQRILNEYGDDVLADDAFFTQGEIYERQLSDKEKAKEIYREFLNKFPGSVFAAEARKRYRVLRGDFPLEEQTTP